jgi:hypothetical protein
MQHRLIPSCCRWNNRHWSLYRIWRSSRKCWTCWRLDCICLCRHPRVQCHGCSWRNGHLLAHRRRLYRLRNSLCRPQSWFCHGLDLLVFVGHHIRTGIDCQRPDYPVLARRSQHWHLHWCLLGYPDGYQLPASLFLWSIYPLSALSKLVER